MNASVRRSAVCQWKSAVASEREDQNHCSSTLLFGLLWITFTPETNTNFRPLLWISLFHTRVVFPLIYWLIKWVNEWVFFHQGHRWLPRHVYGRELEGRQSVLSLVRSYCKTLVIFIVNYRVMSMDENSKAGKVSYRQSCHNCKILVKFSELKKKNTEKKKKKRVTVTVNI